MLLREKIVEKFYAWRSERAISRNDYDLAIQICEEGLSCFPDSRTIRENYLWVCNVLGDDDKFIGILQAAEARHPDDLVIKLHCGVSLMYMSRYQQAVPYLVYCTEHWNGSEQRLAHTYSRLGICYSYLKEWDLAEMALQKAEKVLPWDIDMVYGRICILYGKNETHRILDYLDKNIAKYPKLYPLYFWKAEFIRHHLKGISRSLEDYEAALDRITSRKFKRVFSRVYFTADTNAFPQYILFDYLDTLNDLGKVVEYFPIIRSYIRRCLLSKFDSKDTVIYMHILAGNVQLAEKECRRLMNKIPDAVTRSITLSLLALANVKQNKFEDALQRSMEAISTDATQIFTLRIIGTVLLHLEDWKRAKGIYEKLMVMAPFNRTWQEQLEAITRNLMDHERTISV